MTTINSLNSNKFLFNRSLKDMGFNNPNNIILPSIIYDEKDILNIPYSINSYGYRCNEFFDQNILILGCSQTWGDGMLLEETWPYLLSKKIGFDYINLAKGGDSIQGQTVKSFKFFKDFYNPNYIFAIFPILRLEIPSIDNLFNVEQREINQVIFSNDDIKKFSKFPHNAKDVISEEFAIFYNLIFINLLEQYCESNGIKLFWTIWNDGYYDYNIFKHIYKNINSKNFFIQENSFWNIPNSISPQCHLNYIHNQLFNDAADRRSNGPHWGLHVHMHIAEMMYDQYKKYINSID